MNKLGKTDADCTIRIPDSDLKKQEAPVSGKPESTGGTTAHIRLSQMISNMLNSTSRISIGIFEKGAAGKRIVEPGNSSALKYLQGNVEIDSKLTVSPRPLEESYEIREKLAEGGQGTVSSAKDKLLNRVVAIKTLHSTLKDNPEIRDKFILEAKVTAQLDHPSIIPIYGLRTDSSENLHLAMKLIRGQTLKSYLDSIVANYSLDGIEKFDERQSLMYRLDIFLKVCSAMAYAHHRNVMHCDLKPENIIIGEFGETYIMDWGIARLADDPEYDPKTWVKPKHISGTPRYLSPEAVNGEHCDSRADLYTLGLILYELICLKPAYSGDTSIEVLCKIKENRYENPVHLYHCGVDRDLIAILRKALNRNREDRYQTVSELADDLRRYQQGIEVSAKPDHLFMKVCRFWNLHKKTAMLVTFFFMFLGSASAAVSLYHAVRQSETERHRNSALAAASAKCVNAANRIENHAIRIESVLSAMGVEAITLLHVPVKHPDAIRLYEYTDFLDDKTSPPGIVYSDRYKQKIDLDNFVYKTAPGTKRTEILPALRRLHPLRKRFLRTMLESDPFFHYNPREIAAYKKIILNGGVPVLWAYLGLKEGVHVSFPGNSQYPENFDPRNRPWYKLALARPDTAVWGTPYRDIGFNGGLVITCSMALFDSENRFQGVGALDLSFEYIMKMMNGNGNSRENGVLEKYLLDEDAAVLLNTAYNYSGSGLAGIRKSDDTIVLRPVRDRELRKRLKSDSGFLSFTIRESSGREVLYLAARINSTGWFYIEKIDLAKLLEPPANGMERRL